MGIVLKLSCIACTEDADLKKGILVYGSIQELILITTMISSIQASIPYMYKISRCINFCGFHGPLRFICENEEIYIVMCNSHLKFSKSMKIYHLEN